MKEKLIIWVYILFVFSGIFKWIPIGIDLTLLLAVVMLFFSLNYLNKSIASRMTAVIWPMVVFVIWSIVSIVYSTSVEIWLKKELGILLGFFALVFPIIRMDIFKDYSKVLKVIQQLYFIVLTLMSVEFLFNGMDRILYGGIEHFPKYLMIGMFVGTGVISCLNMSNKILKYTGIFLGIFFMLLLGGRGPFLFLLGVILIHMFYSIKGASKLLILLVIPVLIVLTPKIESVMLFERMSNRLEALGDENNNADLRLNHFSKSFDIVSEHSILGVGLGSYGYYYYGYDVWAYPHNIFVEIMVELGVFALFVFLMLFYFFYRHTNKARNFNESRLIWFLFLYFVLNAMKSSSLVDLRYITAWMGLLLVIDIGEKVKINGRNY